MAELIATEIRSLRVLREKDTGLILEAIDEKDGSTSMKVLGIEVPPKYHDNIDLVIRALTKEEAVTARKRGFLYCSLPERALVLFRGGQRIYLTALAGDFAYRYPEVNAFIEGSPAKGFICRGIIEDEQLRTPVQVERKLIREAGFTYEDFTYDRCLHIDNDNGVQCRNIPTEEGYIFCALHDRTIIDPSLDFFRIAHTNYIRELRTNAVLANFQDGGFRVVGILTKNHSGCVTVRLFP